jgi:sirohydrochlorin cobaltochelatase
MQAFLHMVPFMLPAGDHAINDMSGDRPDSWKSILGKAGYQCEVILKGTGDYPEMVDVWLEHLQEVYSRL